MPKGPTLTKAEREEIATLRASNLSARDIAKRIDRSKTVVLNYLKSPATYGTTKRSGRKRALSKAQEDEIFRALSSGRLPAEDGGAEATEEGDGGGEGGGAEGSDAAPRACKLSAERIKKQFALPLSTRRVQQLLSDWRRSTRKALDQQHALAEEEEAEEQEHEEEASGALALPPPPSLPPAEDDAGHDEDEDEDHGNQSLLEAMPAPAPLVLEEDDAALGMEPPHPTEEVLV